MSLVSTLNADEFAPVRLEIIGDDEVVAAELLEHRLFYLRQVYATALLLGDNREDDLAGVLRDDPRADLEHELVAEEDKLVVLDAGAGSLILSLLAKTKAAYQAVLYACAVPFAEGRKALLGRVAAGTALAELEVRAKAQDVRLKGIDGLLGLAKKIDTIKDKDTRELIRQRFLTDLAGFAPTDVSTARPLALERAHTLEIPLVPPRASSDPAETVARPNRKRANRKKST